MIGYMAQCTNKDCRVLTFLWEKPGDSCPCCGWGGPVSEMTATT